MIKQYEKYKPIKSTVYREAPITWNKYRVKDTVDKNTYYPVGDGDHGSIKPEMYQEEGIPYIRVQNLTWHGEILTDGIVCISEDVQLANKKSILYPGDILIAKTGATIGKLGLIPESIKEANTTSSVGKLTVDKKRFSPKYILYCFQSRALQDQIWLEASQKSAQPGFNIDDLIVFEFLAPDLDSQLKVVDYLDHQTSIIDQLILQKEKLIALLKEKRQAVINEAVTKGLNPNAKMKDSGIDWLGEVPEEWDIIKLKFLIDQLESGVSVNSENSPIDIESADRAVLKTSCVFNYSFIPEENKKVVQEEFDRVQCPVRANSIIISRMNTPDLVGASGYVDRDYPNLFLPDRLWQTVFNDSIELDVEYLSFILKSEIFRNLYGIIATGTSPSMKNISQNSFLDLPIPLPKIESQKNIKTHLREFDGKASISINTLEESIAKLKEYRQSIISEAVTGKIDVRDWSPNKKQMA